MAATVTFSLPPNAARNAFKGMAVPIARAATKAMDTTTVAVKAGGREVIRAAGFSKKWENGWRVTRYPRKTDALDPAIWAFHKIPYAAVFQDGAKIKGSPLLWIPLPTAPKLGRKRMTAALYIKTIGPLHRINRGGKPPLLAGYVRGFGKGGKVTVARLKGGEKRRQTNGTKKLISVPMFVGIQVINIRKRFNFQPMWRKAIVTLQAEFQRNIRGD